MPSREGGWPGALQLVHALYRLHKVRLVVCLPVEVRGQLWHVGLGGVLQVPGVTGVVSITRRTTKTWREGVLSADYNVRIHRSGMC